MYYVTMTDKFMSGWGMASGKVNKLVIECDTYDKAEAIERFAQERSEMRYVNIRTTKPYAKHGQLMSYKTFDDMSGWQKYYRPTVAA